MMTVEWFLFSLIKIIDLTVINIDIIDMTETMLVQIKPFLYMTKKSRQKLKYLEKKKSF